ncbi:MAG: SCO family protein [Candidatus Kaistia colombiensis]|nr:MAG: SCO family protein [Kaistia sp.]
MTDTSKPGDGRNTLRTIRYVLWGLVAIAVIAVAGFALMPKTGPGLQLSAIGGPFTVVDQKGQPVTEAALKGHPSALFFGFTFCPDVCPTTLFQATQWLKQLGPDGDKLKVYFVTVDPERDTPEQMNNYLQAFDPRIIGLTGSRPQIDQMLKAYKVYSKKIGEGEDYTMDHSAAVYLLDSDAKFVGTADYHEKDETIMAKLKRLVAG